MQQWVPHCGTKFGAATVEGWCRFSDPNQVPLFGTTESGAPGGGKFGPHWKGLWRYLQPAKPMQFTLRLSSGGPKLVPPGGARFGAALRHQIWTRKAAPDLGPKSGTCSMQLRHQIWYRKAAPVFAISANTGNVLTQLAVLVWRMEVGLQLEGRLCIRRPPDETQQPQKITQFSSVPEADVTRRKRQVTSPWRHEAILFRQLCQPVRWGA